VTYYILADATFWRVDSGNPSLIQKGGLKWDTDYRTIIFKLNQQWSNATVRNNFTDKIEVDLGPATADEALSSELRLKQRFHRITCPFNWSLHGDLEGNFSKKIKIS
jgi:hypothetical protein